MMIDPATVKIATGSASVDNSGGTSNLTQDVSIVLGELKQVLAVLAVYHTGAATVNSVTISGNTVTVNVTVPAGAAATIHVTAAGY